MYLYIKALHIIFIVTWFAGLFYMPRFFIYATEAGMRPEAERNILREQFRIMMRRLWYGITWPSAILTLIFGPWMWYLLGGFPSWLAVKLVFVVLLYAYHFSIHRIYLQQSKGLFRYSSQFLRIWNEVATIFLIAIVMVAVVKQNLSVLWGLAGLFGFVILLMSAIRIYKALRSR
jgi:protoporphyrinogen IX oxidase